MRLPFLQLESDFLAHGAAELAHLARCTAAQAIGHVSLLRAWAVSHAGDDAPPDGFIAGDAAGRRIEAAAQWQGERGALLEALLDAGQVQHENGGIRVLHLDPYVTAWHKNAKAKERMRTARERSANMRETTSERSAKFGRQMQMQTQKDTPSGSAASAPLASEAEELPDATEAAEEVQEDRPPLVLQAQKPEKPARKPSAGEALFARLEESRQKCCEAAEVPFVPSRWPHARMNRDLGPVARLEADSSKADEWGRFKGAWQAFIEDDEAERLDVPFSLDFFWRMRSRYEGRALKGES